MSIVAQIKNEQQNITNLREILKKYIAFCTQMRYNKFNIKQEVGNSSENYL